MASDGSQLRHSIWGVTVTVPARGSLWLPLCRILVKVRTYNRLSTTVKVLGKRTLHVVMACTCIHCDIIASLCTVRDITVFTREAAKLQVHRAGGCKKNHLSPLWLENEILEQVNLVGCIETTGP